MSGLERRYRVAMRWYPASWRRAHADALLGTLLDRADNEGRTQPTAAELHNLALVGLCKRVAMTLPWVLLVTATAVAILTLPLVGRPIDTTIVVVPMRLIAPLWSFLIAGGLLAGILATAGGIMLWRHRRVRQGDRSTGPGQ